MADTGYKGPLANITVAGFTSWGQPDRIHINQTGSNAAFAVAAGRRNTWYQCFSNEIPEGATIDGVECFFSGSTGVNGIGTAGSTGAAESATFDLRLYNGSSYSSVLYSFTAVGPNDYDNPIIGGPTDLSGLSWDAANQANFGFDIECSAVVDTPVAVITRGIQMKVYYSTSGARGGISSRISRIQSSSTTNLRSIGSTAINNIASIHGI